MPEQTRSAVQAGGTQSNKLLPQSKNPPARQSEPLVLPGSAAYGTLRQRNPKYDGDMLEQIEDMYAGGYQIQKKAPKYMVALDGESQVRRTERCKIAAYMPWFAQIVDQFVSDLFSQHLAVMPAADAPDTSTPGEVPDKEFYGDFQNNVDLRKNTFDDLMKGCITTALKKKKALVQIDAPSNAPQAVNKAIEEELGEGRLYAYEVPVEQLIDWNHDDQGQFVWAILQRRNVERAGPFDVRSEVVETFLVWTMDDDQGVAVWTKYEVRYNPNRVPNDSDLVPKVDEGVTTFKRIPLLKLELKDGLWVGNKIGAMSMEHWQRRASLLGAMNRSLVAVPFVKRGPEIPEQGGAIVETAQDLNRGADPVGTLRRKGYAEIGYQDEIGFAEPEGKCYEIVKSDLKDLKEAMFSVTHQMAASVAPTPGALGRSGLSKQEDGKSTAKVLAALGGIVRQFGCLIYSTVSEARGEDVIWQGHGLDVYEVDDRETLLAEAIAIDQIPIDSPTFKKTQQLQIASKICRNLDPATLATMQDEIEESVEAKKELADLQLDDKKDRLKNPEKYLPIPPQVPGAPPPASPQAPGAPTPKPPPFGQQGKPGQQPGKTPSPGGAKGKP